MSISHALLCLLGTESSTASGLQQRFSAAMQDLWPLNIGQVSQTLARLERDGLVRVSGTRVGASGRHATVYELTDLGRARIAAWWSEPVVRPMSEREEIIAKVVFAADAGADLLGVLDTQRAAVLRQIRALNERASLLPARATAERLIVEKHIYDLEAQARWLDRVEALGTPDRKDTP